MLEVQRVSKNYVGEPILKDLNFTVNSGEIVGFLGVNGAGKTTTMRIATGYLFPTEGDVKVNGHSITKDTIKAQRSIGYLPESNPLYTEMEVWRFLDWVRRVRDADMDHVTEVVDNLELRDVLAKKIGHLSKGYKQRVGLAQAMIGNPAMLILDEPTSGLDPVQKDQILSFIRSFSSEGHAVLFSSHILSEVSEIADRVVIIDHGEIKAQGKPDALMAKDSKNPTITIVIRTKSPLSIVDKALQNLNRRMNLAIEQKGSVHTIKVTLEQKKKESPDSVIEQMSAALLKAKVPLLGLEVAKGDFKDLFTRLTKEH